MENIFKNSKYVEITILKIRIVIGKDDVNNRMFHQDLISKVPHKRFFGIQMVKSGKYIEFKETQWQWINKSSNLN